MGQETDSEYSQGIQDSLEEALADGQQRIKYGQGKHQNSYVYSTLLENAPMNKNAKTCRQRNARKHIHCKHALFIGR
jgi:hypothetical protein